MTIFYQMRISSIQQGWHNHNFAFLEIFPILTIGHKMLLKEIGIFFLPAFFIATDVIEAVYFWSFRLKITYIKHTTIVVVIPLTH